MDKIKIQQILEQIFRLPNQKEIDYLQNFEVKTSNFYGLPKVHKSVQISEECNKAVSAYVAISDVNDLKLRPIIAGPTCQTHRLSDFLDLILKP